MKIMFICTGNICRSPMAEYILRQRIGDKASVGSAGTHALISHPADKTAIRLMNDKKIDMSSHRARQFNMALVQESDLILTMNTEQINYIEKYYPGACKKLHRVGKWSEFDVMDPYKRPLVVFEQVYALLVQGIDDWYRKLWVEHV